MKMCNTGPDPHRSCFVILYIYIPTVSKVLELLPNEFSVPHNALD
jgi:hypothetical protein